MKVSFLRCFQTAGKFKRDWEVVDGNGIGIGIRMDSQSCRTCDREVSSSGRRVEIALKSHI